MEEIIKKYLEERAKTDEALARNLQKPNKSIKECCQYITQEARKQQENGCAMIADDVVYGWAVHYYDEDSIKVEKPKCEVKVATSKPKENKTTDLFSQPKETKAESKPKAGKSNVIEMYPNADKNGQFSLF